MATKTQAAVDGFFDPAIPALLGTKCTQCATVFFPAEETSCRNPYGTATTFDHITLSTTGTIWSYTDAQYQPPPPFVPADPHVPFAIAAVELAEEGIVVLGQVAAGFGVADLAVGMQAELVAETLYSDDDTDYLVWKWRPVKEPANG